MQKAAVRCGLVKIGALVVGKLFPLPESSYPNSAGSSCCSEPLYLIHGANSSWGDNLHWEHFSGSNSTVSYSYGPTLDGAGALHSCCPS